MRDFFLQGPEDKIIPSWWVTLTVSRQISRKRDDDHQCTNATSEVQLFSEGLDGGVQMSVVS